ncbi:MAG TPA: hypothetical protein VMJ10_18160 [Kofleriaceae bacterium]|nr:hypothetical protein [Kofleriaceae bacterium]
MHRLVLVLALSSVFAACGKDTKSSNPNPNPNVDAPPLSGAAHTIMWGPITVQPGVEDTQCIWMKLDNAGEIKVHQMDNNLGPTSHHLIVYKDDMDTTEQTTPVACQPFVGALNTTGMIDPIAITQKKMDEITLPDGVAYTFAANQMIKLELHYINSSDQTPMDASAMVTFYEADPSTIQNEASILFTGSPDIGSCTGCTAINPGAMATLHEYFTVPSDIDLSTSHIFAITGHEHRYGTDVTVNVAPAQTGPMTAVYAPDPFVWSEPITATSDPGFSIPQGGGLDFTCTWTNTGTAAVAFGESANDEMCFFWMYYYPSQGSKVCVHTVQYGGVNGYDLCCPDAASQGICDLITSKF